MRLLDLLIKGAGHKYIKRIPVGTTKTGKVRYRYIYNATHTVGGKHLLDEAHLKPGTKLMLHSKDGAEVHAHIDSVKGDQVTFTYDDGARKGESRTVSKQQLLAEFDKEHKVGEQIDAARDAAISDYARMVYHKTASEKQRKRVYDRIQRLTREIPEVSKPEVETLSSGTGKLAKDLLAKHKVSPNQVAAALKDWQKSTAKSEGNPDVMYLRRLQRLERDGIERAVETYNQALEQAAKDNAGVLAAIEAYRELIDPYNSPDTLNQIIDRKAKFYASYARLLANDGIKAEDYGDLTYAEIKRQNKYVARTYVQTIKRDTGVDMQKTGQTLREACGELNPADFLVAKLKREAAQSAEAKILLAEIEKQVAQTCKDFSYSRSKYKEGDVHASHNIVAKSTGREDIDKRNFESLKANAHYLAHVEDIIQSAYPGREKHRLVHGVLRPGKTRAGCFVGTNVSEMVLHHTSNLRTRVHELAHSLEGKSVNTRSHSGNRYLNKLERDRNTLAVSNTNSAHAEYQLAIQEAVTLTHLTRIKRGEHSKYTGDERTFDDEYHTEYAGKVYTDGVSELVTTGVQEMFRHAEPEAQTTAQAAFAARDPHHFLVTYAILKGYTKHES